MVIHNPIIYFIIVTIQNNFMWCIVLACAIGVLIREIIEYRKKLKEWKQENELNKDKK